MPTLVVEFAADEVVTWKAAWAHEPGAVSAYPDSGAFEACPLERIQTAWFPASHKVLSPGVGSVCFLRDYAAWEDQMVSILDDFGGERSQIRLLLSEPMPTVRKEATDATDAEITSGEGRQRIAQILFECLDVGYVQIVPFGACGGFSGACDWANQSREEDWCACNAGPKPYMENGPSIITDNAPLNTVADMFVVPSSGDLGSWLAGVGAGEYEAAVRDQLGVTELEDLKFVQQSDLEEIGIKGVKARRFLQAAETI